MLIIMCAIVWITFGPLMTVMYLFHRFLPKKLYEKKILKNKVSAINYIK